jgi:predicted metal-binding membrane protein
MLLLVALGVMSVAWMSAIAVLVLVQKLLPPRAAIDVPLALAIVGSRTHATDVRRQQGDEQ